jgi:hypothetical protein
VLGDLPVTVPPSETRSVAVAVVLPANPGMFTRKAFFLVDDEGFRHIAFRMTGRVRAADEETSVMVETR